MTASTALAIQADWERSILAASRDDTALMLTISAHRPARTLARERAPIDIAFVLDRSGSMGGGKIDLVKTAVIEAISHLNPDDRIALVVFDHEIDILQPFASLSGVVRAAIGDTLGTLEARGSTNLSEGWLIGCQQLAEHMPSAADARLQRALLLTDGQANMGITDPNELAHHAAALRQRGIGTTTMGVGVGFDEVLLTSLAESGGGNFHYIEHESQLRTVFVEEIGGLTELAALRPQLEITLPFGTRGELLNAFPNHRQGKTITIDLRDLVDRDHVELVMMVTHRGRVSGNTVSLGCTARYKDPDSREVRSWAIDIPPLTLVADSEAGAAPVNDAVAIARAREQARLDQREGLRLDRAGNYVESRQKFAMSHQRLRDAAADASTRNFVGVSMNLMVELREESARSLDLAAAPEAPLEERIHKERAARHARSSRGNRDSRP